MADFRAFMAASEGVINLLRSNYRPDDFNNELEFRVFTSRDFTNNTITNGVSLFPYRIFVNGVHRSPPGRIGADGTAVQHKLPVEMHCLVTVWAQDASLQNAVAGWVMRILEDSPTLPAGVLNSAVADVFHSDETVNISCAELTTEDLFRIWDVLGVNVYQLSIPYVIRIIEIDSIQPLPDPSAADVQEREFQYADAGS